MNKDTRGTIDFLSTSAKGKPTYSIPSFIILKRVAYLWGKLEENWIMVT